MNPFHIFTIRGTTIEFFSISSAFCWASASFLSVFCAAPALHIERRSEGCRLTLTNYQSLRFRVLNKFHAGARKLQRSLLKMVKVYRISLARPTGKTDFGFYLSFFVFFFSDNLLTRIYIFLNTNR